ncbi:MEDS domain-containing protein [Bradyrhizobium sp.]|uniref:MEDS domain-containing protein n=1 Tax=Bradyrhizobium sp. TaxID=376 RepID=UPI0039C882C5
MKASGRPRWRKPPAGHSHPRGSSNHNGPTPLRSTGIRVADAMPWGAHICLFYETKHDLLDTNAAYIKAGLDDNEYCVWAISQPITQEDAWAALRRDVPDLDGRIAANQLEILPGYNWYLQGGEVDSKKITSGWHEKLQFALDKGFDGLRISGNAFWMENNLWKEFCEYEHELAEMMQDWPMLVLCTYALGASRAVDLLDVARAHHFTVARRRDQWEFLETPELKQAKREIKNLSGALFVLSRPFPGHELLTARERIVLAYIVRGASSKETARSLDVSPRTIEFHRANIMQKLGAKNAVNLVHIVKPPSIIAMSLRVCERSD